MPLTNEELQSIKELRIGEVIVADIIGEGFYRIQNFGKFFVNVECLKLFGKGFIHKGHITNCHRFPEPIDTDYWLSFKRINLKPKTPQP